MTPQEDVPDLLNFSSSSLERRRVDGKPACDRAELTRVGSRSSEKLPELPDQLLSRGFSAENKHTDYEFLLISGIITRKQKLRNFQRDEKNESKNSISIQTLKRYKRPKNRRNRLRGANVVLIATTPQNHSSVTKTFQKGFAKPYYDEYAKGRTKHTNLVSIEMEKNGVPIKFDECSIEDVARSDSEGFGNEAKSRLKISGCLGLVEPGKLVLHCRATIDDREVLTAFSDPVDVKEINFTPALQSYGLNKIVQTVHVDQAGANGFQNAGAKNGLQNPGAKNRFQNPGAKTGVTKTLDVASQSDSCDHASKELCVIDDFRTTVIRSGLARRSVLIKHDNFPYSDTNGSQTQDDSITLDNYKQSNSEESTSGDNSSNNYRVGMNKSQSTQNEPGKHSFGVGENVKIITGKNAQVQTDNYLYSNEVGTSCDLAKKINSRQFVSREVEAKGVSSVKINIQSNNENYNVSYKQNNDKTVNLIVRTKRNNSHRDAEESFKPFFNDSQNNQTVAHFTNNSHRPKTAKFTRTPIALPSNTRLKNSTSKVTNFEKTTAFKDTAEKPYTPRDRYIKSYVRSVSNEDKAEVIYKSERIEADLIYKKPDISLVGNFSVPSSSGRPESIHEGQTKRRNSRQQMSDFSIFSDGQIKQKEDAVKQDDTKNVVTPSQTSSDSMCDAEKDYFVKLKSDSFSNHHPRISCGTYPTLDADSLGGRSDSNTVEKHYRGDQCAYVDPLQRDLEIQALLGIQRQFNVRISDEKTQCDKIQAALCPRKNQERMSPSIPSAFPKAKQRNKKLQCCMVSEKCALSEKKSEQWDLMMLSKAERCLKTKDMGLTVMSSKSTLSGPTQSIISDSLTIHRKDSNIQHYSSNELQIMNDLLHLAISFDDIEKQRMTHKTSNLNASDVKNYSKNTYETSFSDLDLTNLSIGNESSDYDKYSIHNTGPSTQRKDYDESYQDRNDKTEQEQKASDQRFMIKPITLTGSEYKFLKYSILGFVGMNSKSKHPSLSNPWQASKQVMTVNYMTSQHFSHRRPQVSSKRKLRIKKNAISYQRLNASSTKSLQRELPKRLELPETSYTIVPTDRIKTLLKTARESHGDAALKPKKRNTIKLVKAEDMIEDDTSNEKQQVNMNVSWALTEYRSVDMKFFEEARDRSTPQCESITSMVANQEVHNSSIEVLLEPKSLKKKSFLKKLVTCLQPRSKSAPQKSPDSLLNQTQLTDVTSLNDSYRINSSLEAMNISSSLFDTSPSEFSLHSVDSLYVRQKTIVLNATRRLLSPAKPRAFPFGK